MSSPSSSSESVPPAGTAPRVAPVASPVVHAPRPATRGGALDLLRLVAALLIVVYHFGAESPLRIERFHPVFARGYLATDFFLMLSGYVLGRAYGPSAISGRITHFQFWLRRAARVWPGHLMVLAAMAGLVFALNVIGTDAHKPSRFAWDQLPLQAMLMHAWGFNSDGWNLPSWSLSALIVCYALFPWFWRAANLTRRPWLPIVLAAAVVVAFDVASRQTNGFGFSEVSIGLSDLPLRIGVLRALPLFLLGLCLARAVELNWPTEKAAKILLTLGCAGLVILQLIGRFDLPSLVCLAAIILGAGRLPVKHPKAWIEEGAKLSFALFITHILVGVMYWSAVHKLIDTVPIGIGWQWLMWIAGFPLAIGAAWVFHTYIDQPVQDRIMPWVRGRGR
ncbi:acyltransferase [Caulobacter sp. D4A]|uniref:acyltransferase family protein n=1 Tax=Caulobacter sp. D4A TaxID=2204171 RepID=UPI000D72A756|nr:acyltransferase [Caulobacter sp. D4A]PXA85780.1 acyltransferase [Caulobacter sp. D4A]